MSADGRTDLDERLARALDPYLRAEAGGVVLAVSGGPDSTALMHAAATARAACPVHVVTVDHGLRAGSAAEAKAVGALASDLGLPHRVLAWNAPQRTSGIQAAARAARYGLLAAHAIEVRARLLLTGHTADDQAETVLMRLLAGSGPAGLAGMRRERVLGEGVRLARPFLHLPKADLVAYCDAHRLPFVRDPSNVDDRYARARLRNLLPLLTAEGLSTARLCRLAERAARDEAALADAADAAFARAKCQDEAGALILDGTRLRAEPEAIALRIIDRALDRMRLGNAKPIPSRLERLEHLVLDELLPALEAGKTLRRTLRGVLVEARSGGEVRLTPAPPRRSVGGTRHSAPEAPLAAGPPDLLGKGGAPAYIGPERVE